MSFEIAMTLVNLAGLTLAAIGALIAALAVIISEDKAERLSNTYWGGNQTLKRALMDQSRSARNGLICVAFGTMLQAVAIVGPLLK